MQVGMIGLGHMLDAETTPLRNPQYYQYDLNLADIAEVWRRGSVIAAALFERFASQGEADFQDRLLSAMRLGFGGHLENGPRR